MIVLQAYSMNSNGISITTDNPVQFNVTDIDTSCKVEHASGTSAIEIDNSGYYQITFSSFGYNTGAVVEGTPYSGTYSFQLENKGVPVVNAIASASSTSDTETVNVGFSILLYVPPSCRAINNNAVLTINYLGQEGTILGANITVTRLV